jgi:Undecaprenyl-phosphate glucose phosphotransferase
MTEGAHTVKIARASTAQEASSFRRKAPGDKFLFRVLSRWHLILATQMLDFGLIMLVAVLVYPLTVNIAGDSTLHYISGAAVIAIICHFCFGQGHLYHINALLNETSAAKSITLRVSLVFMALAAIAALTHQQALFSRAWFIAFYAGIIVALSVERSIVAALVRSWIARGYITRSVVIVGVNEMTAHLVDRFRTNRFGIRIAGVFDDRSDDRIADGLSGGMTGAAAIPEELGRGGLNSLLQYAAVNPVDLVVIALPITAADRITAVIKQLRQLPLNIRILPGAIGLQRFSPIQLERTELPGVQLITVADRPISEFAWLVKGTLDRLAALIGLILVSPLFLICAIGISMTSPGPVLFRQKRVGYKGREFNIIKFRTMDHEFCGSYAPTRKSDNRVFKFGKLLRRSSLDELPQLINVLKGDMSLVGPRPHMLNQKVEGKCFFDAVNEYASRHRVKPGITGWAQVNGWRGPAETMEQIERRVEHDIYYIENWSPMLDMVILGRTLFKGFFGKNAF